MEKRNLRGDSSMTTGAVVLVENKPANISEHPPLRVFAWLNTRGANAFICHITSTEWKLSHFAILLCRHFRNIAPSFVRVSNQVTKTKSRNKSPLWQDTTFNTLESDTKLSAREQAVMGICIPYTFINIHTQTRNTDSFVISFLKIVICPEFFSRVVVCEKPVCGKKKKIRKARLFAKVGVENYVEKGFELPKILNTHCDAGSHVAA